MRAHDMLASFMEVLMRGHLYLIQNTVDVASKPLGTNKIYPKTHSDSLCDDLKIQLRLLCTVNDQTFSETSP